MISLRFLTINVGTCSARENFKTPEQTKDSVFLNEKWSISVKLFLVILVDNEIPGINP